MALVYRPGIWRPDTSSPPAYGEVIGAGRMFWLPQPVTNLPFGSEWKGQMVASRLKDGGEGKRGNKRAPRSVSITGLVAKTSPDGSVLATEAQMYTQFEQMLEFINSGDISMELFLFYDLATTTYRKYKGVYADSLMSDLGEANYIAFPWSMQLTITHPIIYTTSPGV